MIRAFAGIENKYHVYGQDCMEKFFKSFRKQAMEKIKFQKRK